MPQLIPSSPRILIIKPSSLGDILHTLPLLKTLREALPSSYLVWVVEEAFEDFLAGEKKIDEILVIRTRRWRREPGFNTAAEIWRLVQRLRRLRIDVALDLQGLIKSGVIAWLSRAGLRIGFHKSDMREPVCAFFLNREAERAGPGSHAIERGLALLRPLGIHDFQEKAGIQLGLQDEAPAADFFRKKAPKRPLVAINPGFGFRTKAWPLERYAALGDRLTEERDCSILLSWGPGERGMVDSLARGMKHPPLIPPPTTIRQSAAFFRRCDLFIGSDTGPMHLCAALGIGTLALMGPTDPLRNGPFGEGHTVIQKDIPCRNCYRRRCDSMECMDSIEVEEVFDAASKILMNQIPEKTRSPHTPSPAEGPLH